MHLNNPARKDFLLMVGAGLLSGCASNALPKPPTTTTSTTHYALNTPIQTPQGIVTLLEDGSLVRIDMTNGQTAWMRVYADGHAKAIAADTPDKLPREIRPLICVRPFSEEDNWNWYLALVALAVATATLIAAAGVALASTVVTAGMMAFFAGLGLVALYVGWCAAEAAVAHYYSVARTHAGC